MNCFGLFTQLIMLATIRLGFSEVLPKVSEPIKIKVECSENCNQLVT